MVEKIFKRMDELGISQADMARVVAVAPARISELKRGMWTPDVGQFLRLGRCLGLSLDYLADDALDEPPTPLSDDDRLALMVIHALNLSTPEVIRALNAATRTTSGESKSGGYATVIGRRDLTESDIRREDEALPREAEGDREASETAGRPAGKV